MGGILRNRPDFRYFRPISGYRGRPEASKVCVVCICDGYPGEGAMATKRLYRLSEAARAADATEEELLQAIQDGLLRARLQQNTGEYAIDSDELALWVKRTRHADPLRQ